MTRCRAEKLNGTARIFYILARHHTHQKGPGKMTNFELKIFHSIFAVFSNLYTDINNKLREHCIIYSIVIFIFLTLGPADYQTDPVDNNYHCNLDHK